MSCLEPHGARVTVGPEVATLQFSTYVLKTLLYGLEATILGTTETEILAACHRKNLQYIQHLRASIAITAVYLLTWQHQLKP